MPQGVTRTSLQVHAAKVDEQFMKHIPQRHIRVARAFNVIETDGGGLKVTNRKGELDMAGVLYVERSPSQAPVRA